MVDVSHWHCSHIGICLGVLEGTEMTTVIEMARDAGGRAQQNKNCDVEYLMSAEAFERFAELARADEREACAKVLEDRATHIENNHRRPHYGFPHELRQSIAAIRARSNT